MEISEQVFLLINLLLKVIIITLIVSSPLIIITLEMYAYDRYKKWKNTEDKEYERIIVKRNDSKSTLDEEIKKLDEEKRIKEVDLYVLETKCKALEWIDIPDDNDSDQEIEEVSTEETTSTEDEITEDMTINELKTIAKKQGLSGYSKKSKVELLELLKTEDKNRETP